MGSGAASPVNGVSLGVGPVQAKVADFLLRKSRGKLLLSKVSAKQGKYLQKVRTRAVGRVCDLIVRLPPARPSQVPHSYSSDGAIRYGDTIMLVHEVSGAAVSAEPSEMVHTESQDTLASGASDGSTPTARSTLVLEPIPGDAGSGVAGGALLFGQALRLSTNPSLRVDDESGVALNPLYLASYPVQPHIGATKTSRRMQAADPHPPPFARSQGRPHRPSDGVLLRQARRAHRVVRAGAERVSGGHASAGKQHGGAHAPRHQRGAGHGPQVLSAQ